MAGELQTVLILVMLITLSGVAFLELRYMRKRREKRVASVDLPDRAHNAILTTKAIADALGRGGVRSAEADDLIREADTAYRERNFRVAAELADRAKGVLRTAKLRHQQQGDLSKIEQVKPKGEPEEMTTEEKLTKELPPNLAPSRFTIGLARDDIAAAKLQGRDTSAAERHLADAQASFEKQDYDDALRDAVRARRTLEASAPTDVGTPVAPPTTPPSTTAKARTCVSCGAPIVADDTFCRKCGVKVQGPRACPSCGAEVADDDFCRKCGAKVA